MRRSLAAILLTALLAAGPARADDVAPAPATAGDYSALQQIELTEDEVSRYVASLDDMQKAMGDLPADATEPDAKAMVQLETVAKKHGFRSFDEYNNVAGNISLVVDGIDPDSKTYVGADKLLQKAIDDVKADTKLSEADKSKAAADLETQRKSVLPIKYPSNIDLVLKHYAEINGG